MSETPTRRFEEFDSIIRRCLQVFDRRPDRPENPSTFTAPKPGPRHEGADPRFWTQGELTKQHWDSGRTVGYLAAYVAFAGPTFQAEGIEVSEGYIWLDKGVVCSLLAGDCIEFSAGAFELTEKGRALIAPFVRVRDDAIRVEF